MCQSRPRGLSDSICATNVRHWEWGICWNAVNNPSYYPRLHKLHLKHHWIPATSAALERAFSAAGYIASARHYFARRSGCEILQWVCLSVCPSVCPRGYLRNHARDLYQIFVHVAYVLLRHADDRPHRIYRQEGGDGSAQRGPKCNLRLPYLACHVTCWRKCWLHSATRTC